MFTSPSQFEPVRHALEARKIPIVSAEQTKISSLQVPVGEKEAATLLRLVDALEDHEDVQKVYSNFSVSDELLAKLAR